jgi:adenosylhomocysteine nucleosidase
MPSKNVVVVVAMKRELAPLLRGIWPTRVDGIDFYEMETAAVAVGGIGQRAARRAAEAAITRYNPGMVLSAGTAGALSPVLKIGQIVRSRGAVDADTGMVFSAGGDARVVTVSFVNGPVEKRTIAQRWKFAEAVDMEAAAVAEVAERRGIWFAAIKAISDELEFTMPPLGEFVDQDGKFDTMRFAAFVAMRPRWWSTVRKLGANSKVAAMNLSHALQHPIVHRLKQEQEENVPRV